MYWLSARHPEMRVAAAPFMSCCVQHPDKALSRIKLKLSPHSLAAQIQVCVIYGSLPYISHQT
jgi:hypothetical protein